MPARDDIAYFGAGPARLPTSVLNEASKALLNYKDSGQSICEISHRSALAAELLKDTKAALTSILAIPDTHDILFMQGGASGQFSAVPLNLAAFWVEGRRRAAVRDLGDDYNAVLERVRHELKANFKMDYLVTGSWSLKASQETALMFEPLGKDFVNVALDTRPLSEGKFRTISEGDTWKLTPSNKQASSPAFVYYCDNETVDGVEFPGFPDRLEGKDDAPNPIVVADMSSNIMSRPVDVSKYGVIYFGAQKNLSSAGLVIAVIRKDILTTTPPVEFLHALGIWSPPTVFNWTALYKANSLYNTLELLPVFIANRVLHSLLSRHQSTASDATSKKAVLASQAEVVSQKADTLCSILDANPSIYHVVPDSKARSRMNLCFRVKGGDKAAEGAFLKGANEKGLLGLEGHRSVGGVRISNYNAVTPEEVDRLAKYLKNFAESYPAT